MLVKGPCSSMKRNRCNFSQVTVFTYFVLNSKLIFELQSNCRSIVTSIFIPLFSQYDELLLRTNFFSEIELRRIKIFEKIFSHLLPYLFSNMFLYYFLLAEFIFFNFIHSKQCTSFYTRAYQERIIQYNQLVLF